MTPEIMHVFLESRLNGINEAQKRARVSLFVATLAAGTIIAALWNAYFSWDRQWADTVQRPASWGQEQLLAQQIHDWLQSNTVAVSLLGIRVSASDAAVLGSMVLLIFSFYHCMAKRRENHEIGSLLMSLKEESLELRNYVFLRIQSFMVFTTILDNDSPYETLKESSRPKKGMLLVRLGFKLLTYLPVLTIVFIVLTDIYFSFFYHSPWRGNSGTAWDALSPAYQHQLIFMDSFALITGAFIFYFCHQTMIFHHGTQRVMEEFSKLPQSAGTD